MVQHAKVNSVGQEGVHQVANRDLAEEEGRERRGAVISGAKDASRHN